MTPTPDPRRARLEQLLAIEATQRLTPAEATELDALLAALDEDPDAFELAAAAIHLALSPPWEELPADLAEKLHLTAAVLTPTAPMRVPASVRAPTKRPGNRARPVWAMWGGWAVAAGLAGAFIWALASKPTELVKVVEVPVEIKLPPEPTLEEKRDRLVKDPAAKATRFADAKGTASATIVWSGAKQEGYLEVRGLAANDPNREKYQLWVVDQARKGEKPISAGLFDVKPDGTALVRVNASIPIGDAAAFAITKERPDGVVVSAGPMLLVMSPKQG